MKKFMFWLYITAITVFLVDWGIVGIKISQGDYDFQAGLYIGIACIAIIFVYLIYKVFTNKCPHCGGIRWTNGRFCAHCGKELDK